MVNIRGSTPWTSTTIRAVLDSLYGRSQERYILYTNQYSVRTGITDFCAFRLKMDKTEGHISLCRRATLVSSAIAVELLQNAGSSPVTHAGLGLKVFMDAYMPVTHEERDRYPLGPPY